MQNDQPMTRSDRTTDRGLADAAARLPPRLLDAGCGALTIEFGREVDPAAAARVQALDRAVQAAIDRGALPGVIETMPTFRSLTVLYDPLRTRRAALDAALAPLLAAPVEAATGAGRCWRLPVAYGGEAGADLPALAESAGLSPEAVVQLHAGAVYRVAMIGFLPGFPFMDGLPAALHRPRRTEPRLRVPAGAVAVAMGLTAIYPWPSPGGWHLLGRCPVPLFDASRAAPALLAPGDRVRFTPVTPDELAALEADIHAGRLGPDTWLDTLPEAADADPARG